MNRAAGPHDPPYARIADEIRHRITTGELRPGDRVPSTREITREWGVAMATATRVLATLRQDGLVRAVPGVGTVVEAPEPRPAPAVPATRHRELRPAEPALSQERVVHTAIAIADAEGLPALSMRRIATELGVATMSLYRYVPGKDELLLLMADAALGEDRLPDVPPRGWRARLELTARIQWAGYQRHPWLAPVISVSRPQLLPNGIAHTEWALSAVDGFGLDRSAMLHVAVSLISYVRGTAVNLETEVQAEQDSGLTNEQWMESQDSAMAEIMASGRYPTLATMDGQPDIDFSLDTLFEFGLQRMLDGLAVFLDSSHA